MTDFYNGTSVCSTQETAEQRVRFDLLRLGPRGAVTLQDCDDHVRGN